MAGLSRFNGGVKPAYNKTKSTAIAVRAARMPKRLILPLHQHIGESAKPVVAVGDRVLKGQLIAHTEGYVSAPVHAPTSGTVVDIGHHPVPHPSGLAAPCIVIETDGADRWATLHPAENYQRMDPSQLRNRIREAGIVGLGGAGFPTFIKLNPGPQKSVGTLILNGAECEPYITCDDMLMREHAREIVAGIKIMRHAVHAQECIIAIEDNKSEALRSMEDATRGENGIRVVKVPTLYPQGSEKQLIKTVTGKEVPSNGLPIHIGVVCQNVGTARAVYRAIHYGEPLISRYVTVAGNPVARPCNLEVLIGTPAHELLDECDTDLAELDRVLIGGPMMGFGLHTLNAPVIKTVNCILAASDADTPSTDYVMPCIRCGACMDACPANLLPQQLYWHAKASELEKCEDYNLFDCIECGCCAFVCPSHIPLVQYYRHAKGEIWTKEQEKEKAEQARRRHEFRLERIEREKAERAAKLSKKKADLGAESEITTDAPNAAEEAKKAAILAAMERARAKRETSEGDGSNHKGANDKQNTNTPP